MVDKELFVCCYPNRAIYGEAYSVNGMYDYDAADRCPRCGRIISGGKLQKPRIVELAGNKVADIVYGYCFEAPFAVSERFVELYQASDLKGIKSFSPLDDVRFRRKAMKDAPKPTLYTVELERSCITVDHANSLIVYGFRKCGEYCPLCNPFPKTRNFYKRICMKMEGFENYDIFWTHEQGGTTFMTSRFIDFCEKNRLTNLHYRPLSEYVSDNGWSNEVFEQERLASLIFEDEDA